MLALPEGEEATYDVLGLWGYIDPNERGLLVPPRTGDEGARFGKYSLMGLLELFWASLPAIISGNGPPGVPGLTPPPTPPPGPGNYQNLLKGGPNYVDAQKVHPFIDEINNKTLS